MKELTLKNVTAAMSATRTPDYLRGLLDAANMANEYHGHPYLIGDCILAKLNILKGEPRKDRHYKRSKL